MIRRMPRAWHWSAWIKGGKRLRRCTEPLIEKDEVNHAEPAVCATSGSRRLPLVGVSVTAGQERPDGIAARSGVEITAQNDIHVAMVDRFQLIGKLGHLGQPPARGRGGFGRVPLEVGIGHEERAVAMAEMGKLGKPMTWPGGWEFRVVEPSGPIEPDRAISIK